MALGGYRRTRGLHSRVVPTRRDQDGYVSNNSPAPTSLAARRGAQLLAQPTVMPLRLEAKTLPDLRARRRLNV